MTRLAMALILLPLLAACGSTSSTPSPSPVPTPTPAAPAPTPTPAPQPAPAPTPSTFSLTGVITDATTHGVLAGARVEVLTGINAGKVAVADSSGTYLLTSLIEDTFRLRASANDHDYGEQSVTVPANPRADFELRPILPNYAGIWTGSYSVTACQDMDPPGTTPILLCGQFAHLLGTPVALNYQFTLSQSGTTVTGTYKLVSPMFSCPCAGDYGTFDMFGTVAPDGTLTLAGAGTPRGSGVQTAIVFTLRITSSALTGTVSGTHSVGGVARATFSGTLLSGTR